LRERHAGVIRPRSSRCHCEAAVGMRQIALHLRARRYFASSRRSPPLTNRAA
jgi:hypothetical protein